MDTLVDNIGRTWPAPYGTQVIEALLGDLYSVRTIETGAERRYTARSIEEVIKQDTFRTTPAYQEQLAEEAELAELRRQRREREELAKQATESRIARFTEGLSPMQAGKVRAALLTEVCYRGMPTTRLALIERLVSAGAIVTSQEGQPAIEGNDGAYLTSKTLTKTGIEYAQHFLASLK